jgi:hypothetical protein
LSDFDLARPIPQVPESNLVLDKSFLQAVPGDRIQELAQQYRLVMTDALFHELLTTDPVVRARSFGKFPKVDNPVTVVGHIGPMLLHEQRTRTRASDFLGYQVRERFRFNARLQLPEFELVPEVTANIEEETSRVNESVQAYIDRVNNSLSFFPEVQAGSDAARRAAMDSYAADLAKPETIVGFYRTVDDPALPPADLLTPEWATFRLFQVSLLFALHTVHRHRGPIPSAPSPRELVRLEHDVHDEEMFLTAAMAGGLATRESKLIDWWRLLFPDKPLLID